MKTEELNQILKQHKLWLNSTEEGICADLHGADLRNADLSGANLSNANLSNANLSNADLSNAYLSNADLRNADLRNADLSDADLSNANLSNAYLRYANLSGANLSNADLSNADLSNAYLSNAYLSYANLSGANGLTSSIDFMNAHFEKSEDGYFAYKTFGEVYPPNKNWKIKKHSIISENVNYTKTNLCGCGINVAPLKWVKKNYQGNIWKVLIRWEWLSGVCVPYNSDGKIRCERVELIEKVDRDNGN